MLTTRNPLYLGSILIALGFIVAARSLWIGAGAIAMFVVGYLPVIRAEESYVTLSVHGLQRSTRCMCLDFSGGLRNIDRQPG